MSTQSKPLRRIVTGHTPDGKAVAIFDDATPQKVARADTGIVAHWVWSTDGSPADIAVTQDASAVRRGLAPPANGSIFRVVDFPPVRGDVAAQDHGQMAKNLGLHSAPGKRLPPSHPFMHFTETIDYAIIVSGKIDMVLDEETYTLGPGDVVVQQATNHAWVNHGPEMCRIAFVLIDARPF